MTLSLQPRHPEGFASRIHANFDENTIEVPNLEPLFSARAQRENTEAEKSIAAEVMKFDLDAETDRLSKNLKNILSGGNVDFTQLERLLRDLFILMSRQAGKLDKKLARDLIDNIRIQVQGIKKTHNSPMSLIFTVGTGALHMLAGALSIPAETQSIAQALNVFSKGAGSLGKIWKSKDEGERTVLQADLQLLQSTLESRRESSRQYQGKQSQSQQEQSEAARKVHQAIGEMLSPR